MRMTDHSLPQHWEDEDDLSQPATMLWARMQLVLGMIHLIEYDS